MLQGARKISLFSRIFNVYGTEWPRIVIAWTIRFLFRTAFVVSWTIIVAMFVSKYGIASLPYLFIANAIFTIVGSVIYSNFIEKFSKEAIMLLTILCAGIVLFVASYFAAVNEILFFALLVCAEAIFLIQFKLVLDAFTEEIFTPLESERTFPIIETAETLGGLLAGVAILSLSGKIETFRFVYLWIALMFLMVPFILFKGNFTNKLPLPKKRHEQENTSLGLFKKIKAHFSNSSHLTFIKGLFLMVFLQWLLFNLMEFQYTKAVYQNVSNIIVDSGGGFEHSFAHELGILAILINVSALIVQLILGGRIIHSLGIIGSMILHPVVTILSLLGLTSSFNIYSAVLAKNNFTMTTIIYVNAYHSAYYAISERLREYSREIMEGILRPLGALSGTFVLLLLQVFFKGSVLIFYVNLSMILVALIFLYVTYRQQNKYTDVATNDFINSHEREVRYNSIDILVQKGHKSSLPLLSTYLLNENESLALRIKILRSLAASENEETLLDIVKCLDSKQAKLRNLALEVLCTHPAWEKSLKKVLSVRYELFHALKRLYCANGTEESRSKIIWLMSKVSSVAELEFLFELLKKSSTQVKSDVIKALGNTNDFEITTQLAPYLKSKNINLKIAAAVALFQFEEYQEQAEYIISSFAHSNKNSQIKLSLEAIGELKLKNKKSICYKYLEVKNAELKRESALALLKIDDSRAITPMVHMIFDLKHEDSLELMAQIRNLDSGVAVKVCKIVKKIVSQEINKIFANKKLDLLEELKQKDLSRLRWLYGLINQKDEIEIIDDIIPKK